MESRLSQGHSIVSNYYGLNGNWTSLYSTPPAHRSLQQLLFPRDHPTRYWLGSVLLNFSNGNVCFFLLMEFNLLKNINLIKVISTLFQISKYDLACKLLIILTQNTFSIEFHTMMYNLY